MDRMDDILTLDIGAATIPLRLRRSARARRLALRLDGHEGDVVLVLPPGVTVAAGLRFAEDNAVWLANRLATLPPRVPFADGARVPFLGEMHVIRHRPESRGTVWRADGVLHVAGGGEHLARRLRDWLKAEARRTLADRTRGKAATLGRSIARVSVRETRSRWGSCSTKGNLSFCWRLILAPEPVLDYVVAHEVAHLAEMNHGPRFWQQVARLTAEVDGPRRWLARNSARLHRYG